VILEYSEITYFVVYGLIWFVVFLLLSIKTKQIQALTHVPKTYWKLRPIGSL